MKAKKVIVCVCRGNISRSPVAEAVIRNELNQRNLSDKYSSISRGIQGTVVDPMPAKFPNLTFYGKVYEDTKPTLKKFGINLSTHTSTSIDKCTANKASILLALDNRTKQALLTLFPENANKIHILSELVNEDRDIIDPEGVSGTDKQEKILTEIRDIIICGFSKLLLLTN